MLLSEKERNVTELCADLGTQSQPAVSHHLALLRHGRLIEPRRSGQAQFLRPDRRRPRAGPGRQFRRQLIARTELRRSAHIGGSIGPPCESLAGRSWRPDGRLAPGRRGSGRGERERSILARSLAAPARSDQLAQPVAADTPARGDVAQPAGLIADLALDDERAGVADALERLDELGMLTSPSPSGTSSPHWSGRAAVGHP